MASKLFISAKEVAKELLSKEKSAVNILKNEFTV